MFKLFIYKTPAKFADAFKSYYVQANLKQVRTLSAVFFSVALFFRILSLIFHDKLVNIQNYDAYSFLNWIQLGCTLFFLVLSSTALKFDWQSTWKKKAITSTFIIFLLLIALGASYTVSMFNTKNTLTLFLIGITTVSLFFAIEYLEIQLTVAFITIVYWFSMAFGKISFDDKVSNIFAGLILGLILLCFSRYSYYFKSQHFVKIKELEEKNLEIERLYSQQGEILGFVAHDLRNPLNNIEALSTLMLYEGTPKEELRLILNAAHQAKNIINDLIEVVKADKSKLEFEALELSAFLNEIIEKWRTNSKRTFNLELSESSVITYANSSKLERVMDNLISNALKFSPVDKAVSISLNKDEEHIEIKVKDEGIGIPKVLLGTIFQQFSKAGRNGLLGEKSVGLGLHISQRIMENHGGKLGVESRENKGSTFILTLPIS
ncbi:MAG: HAMP domain-containing sensor histidine kinase [Bacteroidota bacterium]